MSLSENPFSPMATYDSQTTISSISSLDPKLSRTHYYDGRLLRASDLTRDQFYLDERLREVGRVLGQGIVRGLEVSLTGDRKLNVTAGLAITPSGRVLELETESITLNLTDAALIHEMNPGFRSLQPGLYVVVARYAEKGTGSAEIYPRDLEAERGFHFNAYQEGLQFALVKLPLNLPLEKIQNISANEVAVYIRALLVRPLLLANSGQPQSIGEDAVALGVMGVEYGMPQWLDKGLLRRPFRSVQSLNTFLSNSLQQDLYSHYEELFADIVSLRQSTANQDKFLASRYFSVLPPVGSLPKMAIDPINAYQHFFPEAFEVSISPVRADDLPSLIQQSLALEPIDLQNDQDVDIMIAVVLDNLNFSLIARQLENRSEAQLAHLDEMSLSPYGQKNSGQQINIWQKVWDFAQQVIYLRRPVRVAETQVSAVVLAKGDYASLPVISTAIKYDLSTRIKEFREKELLNEKKEKEYKDKIESLLKKIEDLKKENPDQLEEEKELVQKASETLEATVGAFEDLNEELDKKSKTLQDNILKITEELNLLKGDDLKKAKEDLAAALAANATLVDNRRVLEAEIKSLQAKIKELQENGGTTPDQDTEKLKKQLSQLQQQLAGLQELISTLWNSQEVQLENLSILSKLRSVNDEKALNTQQSLLKEVEQNSKLQPALMQLLSLMQPTFDELNWLSLGFIFKNEIQEKAIEIFAKLKDENYLDVVLVVAKELGFPDELHESWKQLAEKELIPRFSPVNLSEVKTLKLNQLLPASLEVSEENRAAIKSATSADSSLLKPLSQLKALVSEKYQLLLWATVPVIIDSGKLPDFLDFVLKVTQKSLPLGLSIAATNSRFKIPASLRSSWADLDLES